MRTRIRLGISICIAVAASQGAAFAQGAVTVIGGGLARASGGEGDVNLPLHTSPEFRFG